VRNTLGDEVRLPDFLKVFFFFFRFIAGDATVSYLYVVVVTVRFPISVSSSGFDAAISCGNKLRIQITKKGLN